MTEGESNGLLSCPYGCSCKFVSQKDINDHLRAFSYKDRYTTRDQHLDLWNHEQARRKMRGE